MWPCSGVGVVRTRSLVVTGLGLDGYDLHSSPGMWYQDKVRPRLIHKSLRRGRRNLISALYSNWLFSFLKNVEWHMRYILSHNTTIDIFLDPKCGRHLIDNTRDIIYTSDIGMLWMHCSFQRNTSDSINIPWHIPSHLNSPSTDRPQCPAEPHCNCKET